MFVQSGGCCAGSVPLCFPLGEFIMGDVDVLAAIQLHLPVTGAVDNDPLTHQVTDLKDQGQAQTTGLVPTLSRRLTSRRLTLE